MGKMGGGTAKQGKSSSGKGHRLCTIKESGKGIEEKNKGLGKISEVRRQERAIEGGSMKAGDLKREIPLETKRPRKGVYTAWRTRSILKIKTRINGGESDGRGTLRQKAGTKKL